MTRDEAKNLRPGTKVKLYNPLGPERIFIIGDLVNFGDLIYLTDDDFAFSMEVSPQELVLV